MKGLTLVLQSLLAIWFFGCIRTYRIKNRVLVDGMGVKSAEFVMLCLYLVGVSLFWIFPPVGKWWLLTVLTAWLVIQFFCHWYYTIFGASEKKLRGYNECFRNTVHLIAASPTRVIPDLYHILLHTLILTNLILVLASILR